MNLFKKGVVTSSEMCSWENRMILRGQRQCGWKSLLSALMSPNPETTRMSPLHQFSSIANSSGAALRTDCAYEITQDATAGASAKNSMRC